MTSTSHPVVWTKTPIAARAPRASEGEIARVEVFPTLGQTRRDWLELEAVARASPYQAFAFAEAWFSTIGAAGGFEPFIVVARDECGQPAALLPLARRRRGPLAVATFLGGKDSNFNLGLFRPGRLWSAGEIRSLIWRRRAPLRRASTGSRSSTSRATGRARGTPWPPSAAGRARVSPTSRSSRCRFPPGATRISRRPRRRTCAGRPVSWRRWARLLMSRRKTKRRRHASWPPFSTRSASGRPTAGRPTLMKAPLAQAFLRRLARLRASPGHPQRWSCTLSCLAIAPSLSWGPCPDGFA